MLICAVASLEFTQMISSHLRKYNLFRGYRITGSNNSLLYSSCHHFCHAEQSSSVKLTYSSLCPSSFTPAPHFPTIPPIFLFSFRSMILTQVLSHCSGVQRRTVIKRASDSVSFPQEHQPEYPARLQASLRWGMWSTMKMLIRWSWPFIRKERELKPQGSIWLDAKVSASCLRDPG